MHHPHACTERTTLPRKIGGRGIIDILNVNNKLVETLRNYFHTKASESPLHNAVVNADKSITPLNLQSVEWQSTYVTQQQKIESWRTKQMHGKHCYDLHNEYVDLEMSNLWLSKSNIFAETEGLLLAMQDRILMTRNYRRYIIKETNSLPDNCRRCGLRGETVEHILNYCPTLVSTDYLKRHNDVAKIIHSVIAQYNKLDQDIQPYYKYNPEPVLENSKVKLYWDRTILTNITREHNRPDITYIDKTKKITYFIEIACPLSQNLHSTYVEKLNKYSDLAIEVQGQWKMKEVKVLPIIISSAGLVHIAVKQNLEMLRIHPMKIIQMQQSVLLNVAHTIRKFLS